MNMAILCGCRICKLHLCNVYSGYETKLYLIVKFQSWSFKEIGVSFHCHYSQVHFVSAVIVTNKVQTIGQIEQFNLLLRIMIIISYLKSYSYPQIIYIT